MAIIRGFSWTNPFLKVGKTRASGQKNDIFLTFKIRGQKQKWAKPIFRVQKWAEK